MRLLNGSPFGAWQFAWQGVAGVDRSERYLAIVLATTLLLLLLARLRAELVALLVLIALEIPGVVSREEALSGFSNSAVITIIGLFVISAALQQTGVADQMAGLLVRVGGNSERRLIPLVMLSTALLSLVMNNIAAGAVMLPATILVARRMRIPPAKLLMPLAFGASLGGMATIFTTANILVSNTLRSGGFVPLGFLDFLPIGTLLVVAGIAYMVVFGARLLPHTDPFAAVAYGSALSDVYRLQERLWEVQVPASSQLAEATLARADLGELFGLTVVAVFHGQSGIHAPGPATMLHAGDVLLVAGREEQVRRLPGVTVGRGTRSRRYFTDPHVQMAEVVIAPRAMILGQTLKQLEFRRRYGVTVVAVWQNGTAIRTHIGELPLQAGDALLVVGPPERLVLMQNDPSLIMATPLPKKSGQGQPSQRRLALAITALVLILSTGQWLPTSIAVLVGVVLLVLSRVMTMDEALAAIEWKTIFVIAGMLPLSTAMQKTGLAATIGTQLVNIFGVLGFVPLVAALYLVTMGLAQVLGGQVTALVMGPIGIAAALATHASPRAVGVVVAIACSTAFLTPLAHPVNLLMMGPGGYTFRDYLRVGAGLTVVCCVVVLLGLFLLPQG